MRISGYRGTEKQLLLFPEPLRGAGHVRVIIGNLVETLTAVLVGGRRHKTQSNVDYCPDVSCARGYFESKAVGRNRAGFVYGGRLRKDQRFATTQSLYYVLWHHVAATRLADTVEGLEALVLANLRAVWVVSFSRLHAICAATAEVRINSAYGPQGNVLYGSGHRFALSKLGEPLRRYEERLDSVQVLKPLTEDEWQLVV